MEQQNHGNAREPTLAALLRDLTALEGYLSERGRHTYDLAQRFLENARRDPSNRAFDERQAAMLDYQHYIWHEIAGMVNKLLVTYGPDESQGAGVDGEPETPEGAR
jgi:hypothetical protein